LASVFVVPGPAAGAPFEMPCLKTGGCVDKAPDPCANGKCDGIPPLPPMQSELSRQTEAFRAELGAFGQYLDVYRFRTAANPATDGELSARLDDFYAFAYREFLNLSPRVAAARNAVLQLERSNGYLRGAIPIWNEEIPTLHAANAALEAKVLPAEQRLRRVEAMGEQLSNTALTLINEPKVLQKLISYIEVFGRDPAFMRYEREHHNYAHMIDPWFSISEKRLDGPPPYPTAPPAAPAAPDGMLIPLTKMVYLTQTAPIDAKLAELNALDSLFRRAYDQIADDDRRAGALTSEYAALKTVGDGLSATREALNKAGTDLKNRLAIAEKYLPLAETNRKSGAMTLAREVMVSFAKDEALDRAKSAVDGLLGVAGVTSSIPTSAEDLVVAAAKAGRRVLIPTAGYKAQWDAFLKVQQQTSTLVTRAQGYVEEAARLCAQGSPGEIQQHITKVFSAVNDEAADYTLAVGFSDLPDNEAGIFEKALSKYLDARKSPK
jgi:hypothetical protein